MLLLERENNARQQQQKTKKTKNKTSSYNKKIKGTHLGNLNMSKKTR